MDLRSGLPFWTVNDGLIRTYPRLDEDVRCTVAVVGGGITGALVGYHLTEAGIDAVVLDKREVGWGSTAASTALLQYELDTTLSDLTARRGAEVASRAYLACRDAVKRLGAMANGLAMPTMFEQKQSLYLAGTERDRDVLQRECELRRAIGISVDFLVESDIAEQFPFRRPAALLSADAAQVDAYALTHALFDDATRRGLRVFDRTNVTHLDATSAGVALTTADGCIVRARFLVFATGYETHDYLATPVATLASTYAIASEPLPSIDNWGHDQCIIWEHARPYLYLRTTSDHRVIIGGEDEAFRDGDARDRLIPEKAERLVERFSSLFPDVRFEIAFAWAGTFGETADGLAYIGDQSDWPSTFFALGYGGNGITFSLLAAEIIRDAILGKRHADAELFRFGR
ncbi:MAG: FAD-dependent oxidoreductase [Gemmatimonadota bacterium]